MSNTVTVEFYKTNSLGQSIICRTDVCSNLLEADYFAAEEMKTGQYDAVVIKENDKCSNLK